MPQTKLDAPISRRRALALGGGVAAGGLLSAASPLPGTAAAAAGTLGHESKSGRLPAAKIQEIVQAKGTVTSGVLSIDIARNDIGKVSGPRGVTFTSAFQVDGALTFQPLGAGRAFFNGDIPIKESEIDRFIDALIANRLVLQAFHQHFDQTDPRLWFMHFRGKGGPIQLAHAVHNVLKATSTPLPQTMPSHPKSPLSSSRLAKTLHGSAQVGEEGVVTVMVSRKGKIVIDGVRVSPEANISTNVQFKPLNATGSSTAAAADFAMTAQETQAVLATMRRRGWHVGCLYNQETDERPQLYFAHMLKTGDPYALAREVRAGVDHTHAD